MTFVSLWNAANVYIKYIDLKFKLNKNVFNLHVQICDIKPNLHANIWSTLFVPLSFDYVAYSLSEHTVLTKYVDCSNVQWWSKKPTLIYLVDHVDNQLI